MTLAIPTSSSIERKMKPLAMPDLGNEASIHLTILEANVAAPTMIRSVRTESSFKERGIHDIGNVPDTQEVRNGGTSPDIEEICSASRRSSPPRTVLGAAKAAPPCGHRYIAVKENFADERAHAALNCSGLFSKAKSSRR